MAGNTIGTLFTVTTFGESHGPAIGCVIDGCPPGMELSESDFVADIDRRKTGKSRHTSQRKEPDAVQILSGVFEGNILTFNPGWDQNARNIDPFTDIREIQKRLKADGVVLESEAEEAGDGPASFTLSDPDGNAILFDQHR